MNHQDEFQVPQGYESQAWFRDSVNSHHINSSTSNLQNKHSCEGSYKVLVGNGHSLAVKSSKFCVKLYVALK